MISNYRSILVNYYDTFYIYIYIYIRYIMDLYIYNIIHINYTFKTFVFPSFSRMSSKPSRFCWVFPRSMLFQNGRTVNQLFDALSAGKVWAGLVVVTSNRDRQNTKGTTKRGRWVFFFLCGGGGVWKSSEIYGDCYC